MNDCPNTSENFCVMIRATLSVPPPGASPTSTRTGRSGYDWAQAAAASAALPNTTPATKTTRELRISLLDLVRKANDETVAVWHTHARQRVGVHRVVLADQLVEREQVSGQCIDLVVGKRLRLLPRHCTPNIIKNRRRIRPEIGDGLNRFHAGQWRSSDQRGIGSALAVFAVACCTFFRVNAGALRGRAAARRQTAAVRKNIDVPSCHFGGCNRLAKSRPVSRGNAYDASQCDACSTARKFMHKHV